MKKSIMAVITALAVTNFVGCDKKSQSDNANSNRGYSSKAEADAASPAGLSCEVVIQVPISRGRGGGLDGKYETEVLYFPAYLRGDINSDGQITRDDALLAVKKFFKPENFNCARAADVGGYPQTEIPDGFFTSQDVYIFNQFKSSGIITWPQDLICGQDCEIVNHMLP